MRLPEGTSIGVTTETARKAEAMVAGDESLGRPERCSAMTSP